MAENDLPLSGVGVLVTRAEHQARDLVNGLKELGAKPIEMPVIEIHPPDSWDELDNAIAKLDQYDWIIFASANAVRGFICRGALHAPAELDSCNPVDPASILTGACNAPLQSNVSGKNVSMPKIAVIGNSTEQAAQEAGLKVDYKPDISIAENFVEQFPGYPNLEGRRILWPRTNIGRNYIAEKFTAAGAKVDVVAAYKTCLPSNIKELSERLHQLIEKKEIQVITLASAQTANNLAEIIKYKWKDSNQSDVDLSVVQPLAASHGAIGIRASKEGHGNAMPLQNILIVSIGPETSAGARTALGKVDLEANPHNTAGIIAVLVKHFDQR